tara:strand:+ start:975 stop:2495 length:1521 start_codon:yes stop_codon:yes gene_type:complete
MSLKQMYDAIIFTEVSNWPIPMKTIGAYKIAQSMRQRGYKVKVINNFLEVWDNHREDLIFWIKDILKPDAKFIGISGTFASGLTHINKQYNFGTILKDSPWNTFNLFLDDMKEFFPNVPIVLGGHTKASRNIFDKLKDSKIDYWVDGIAEESIHKFLNEKEPPQRFRYDILGLTHDFHNGKPVFVKEDGIMPYEVLPFEMSRGCRFKCSFCSYPLLGKNPHDNKYLRSEKSIYDELKSNYENFGTTKYNMLCDTFNETTEKLETLCRVQDKLKINIKFSSYLRIDLLHAHKEQIPLLHEAGLNTCHFGLETFNHESAKSIGKGLRKEKVKETLHLCKEIWGDDVLTNAGFITGLPYETPDTANVWCQELFDEEYPLDTWYLTTLAFINQGKDVDEYPYSSAFEKDPAKYGYTFAEDEPTNWNNGSFTKKSAAKFAESWREKWKEKIKIGSWHAMGLQSYNIYDEFHWEDIRKLKRHHMIDGSEGLTERLNGLKKRYIKDYWNRVSI